MKDVIGKCAGFVIGAAIAISIVYGVIAIYESNNEPEKAETQDVQEPEIDANTYKVWHNALKRDKEHNKKRYEFLLPLFKKALSDGYITQDEYLDIISWTKVWQAEQVRDKYRKRLSDLIKEDNNVVERE